MTPQDTVRRGLLEYPSLFRSPLDVLDQLFAVIGNGYEWVKGELVDTCGYVNPKKTPGKMDYADLNERAAERAADRERYDIEYGRIDTMFALDIEAERHHRQWVEANIDRIIYAPLTRRYGGASQHKPSSYTTQNISTTYARGLNFPDDITLAWGEVLSEYLSAWLVTLNVVHGIGHSRDFAEATKHWPQEIKDAHAAIVAAQHRLHPLIRGGQTLAEHEKHCHDVMTEIIADIKKV